MLIHYQVNYLQHAEGQLDYGTWTAGRRATKPFLPALAAWWKLAGVDAFAQTLVEEVNLIILETPLDRTEYFDEVNDLAKNIAEDA